jgi:hypothetical protein
MDNVLMQVGIQMAAYITVILISFFGMNWFTNGFVFPAISCKLGRGRKVLLFVESKTDPYYKVGKLSSGFLLYKDNEKKQHRIAIPKDVKISHIGGVKSMFINEETDELINMSWDGKTGFDAVKFENLYIRALTDPGFEDKQQKIILLACVVGAIAAVVCLWLVYMQGLDLALIKNNLLGAVI